MKWPTIGIFLSGAILGGFVAVATRDLLVDFQSRSDIIELYYSSDSQTDVDDAKLYVNEGLIWQGRLTRAGGPVVTEVPGGPSGGLTLVMGEKRMEDVGYIAGIGHRYTMWIDQSGDVKLQECPRVSNH